MISSKLADDIQPNIFSVLEAKRRELAAQGRELIHLHVGTPDFLPDRHVVDALSQAAADPANYGYALMDLPELTESVIQWYSRRYGVSLTPDQVTSVNGSQEGCAHIAFSLINPGDTVIVTNPGYPIFSFGPRMAGAKLYEAPLLRENHFLVDFEAIPRAVAEAAKVIVVSYPNNPVTTVADDEFYEKLIAFAKRYNIAVIHDNAYSEIVFTGKPGISFLSVPGAMDVGIEFNSLSKSYNLTGARISFALGNREIISNFKKIRSQIDYGVFLPIQRAAIAALNGPQDILERDRALYRQRRDALCGGLRSIGWDVPDSEATMFVWAHLPEGYTDSFSFAMELLEKTGVMCVPGENFGSLGREYVRFALTAPPEKIQLAVRKIKESGMLSK